MHRYLGVWVFLGLLSPLVLAVGAVECTEKEKLLDLKPKPTSMQRPTDCLLECTSMTYTKKLQLQDKHNIRIKDSTEGVIGEYCWSTELKCTVGESFSSAFVVLPVDVAAVGPEQLAVSATSPTASVLQAHGRPTTIAESCGLIYEVTPHFSAPGTDTSFCVQVGTQEDEWGDRVLKCPPYLVTFWQRNPNQSNQHVGG
ncbi:unnamed protein product [Menidia menidia]|uniref:(Atlantic silverside) hypothetical protein n=1 Tax=Menidia menidia TaxID=238744 RepID=A0A8S4AID4_9TELE|nr:unnamed protein product [Menidia menidia]